MLHRFPSMASLVWVALLLGSVPAIAAPAAATPSCPPAQDLVACVSALRNDDPAAALRLGLPAWQAGQAGQGASARVPLGLELVDAAADANQLDQVIAIGNLLLAQGALTPPQRVRLLQKLNGAIWQARDTKRIAALETEMTRLERVLPQEPTLARMWRQLAASYYKMGAQDDALRVAKLALSKVASHPDTVEYDANQIVFIVSAQQGRMPEAIQALIETERVGKALGRPADPALLLNATGVFIYAHEWERAIDYGQRALAAFDATPRKGLSRADMLESLGSAYEGAGQHERAVAIYRQALDSAHTAGAPAPASTLNNLANVLQEQGRHAEALPLLREAAAQIEGAGDNGVGGIVHSNIGAALVALGQRDAAAAEFARSRSLFAQSDNVTRRLELYPRMIDNLDALGRAREALALMREYKQVNDAAVNVESKTRIAELQSAVDLERKKGELAAVARARAAEQADYAQLQARAQRQRMALYGLLATLLVLAAFGVWKVREARIRSRINRELARKNAEIQAQHHALEQLNALIRRQSEEDALTGLRNRRYVTTWWQARQNGTPADAAAQPALLMLLDVDHFKRVNDVHGHEAGDHALMHLAELLRDCARSSDVVARWGGEEFLWICPGGTLADVPGLFQRLRDRLQQHPLQRPGGTIPLTVSMGASLHPARPGADWDHSLRLADTALYRAKHAGRDRWVALVLDSAAPATIDAGAPPSMAWLEAQGHLRQSSGGASEAAQATAHTTG